MRTVVCSQPPESSPRSGSGPGSPGLLARLRERIRYLHYSLRTEQAYVYWARAFVGYHGMRHPRDLGHSDVSTTMIYTHVLESGAAGTPSPLDGLVLGATPHAAEIDAPAGADSAPAQPPPIPARTTADRSHRFGTTSDE